MTHADPAMASDAHPPAPATPAAARTGAVRTALLLARLARPHQWSKSAFVVVGPVYWLQANRPESWADFVLTVLLAGAAFALASSGCYVFNDLADVALDRAHPRKKHRPIAAGLVSPGLARAFAVGLFACAAVACAAMALVQPAAHAAVAGVFLAVYVGNVLWYSASLKRRLVVDVMSLSMGFVLRVFGGCVAVGIAPTTWLLNVVFFLSMLLAFGKRLGERRAAGENASRVRDVHRLYSDELLRMLVVVCGVATILTYAGYVTTRDGDFTLMGVNLLWLTLLPATFGLLRAIAQLERGRFDDPTELAVKDRPFQLAAALFGVVTAGLIAARLAGWRGSASAAEPLPKQGSAEAAAPALGGLQGGKGDAE